MRINSIDTAFKCVECLQQKYKVPRVVISSFVVEENGVEKLYCIGSSIYSKSFFVLIPVIPGIFRGTGDLFTALMAAHIAESPDCTESLASIKEDKLKKSVEMALSSVHEVIQKTADRISALGVEEYHPAYAELCIVNSQNSIIAPSKLFEAVYYY